MIEGFFLNPLPLINAQLKGISQFHQHQAVKHHDALYGFSFGFL
jgi:hypothetical protein